MALIGGVVVILPVAWMVFLLIKAMTEVQKVY
jgi:large-conductance mechanosensitive channel